MTEHQANVDNLRRIELLNRQFALPGLTEQERNELDQLTRRLDQHHCQRYGPQTIERLGGPL